MTLDIPKFISNAISTQAKIQHLEMSTKTSSAGSIPASVKKLIEREYGKKYLLDADYVSFFWGQLGKDEIKRLFKVVDKALGTSANKLTETDFKKLSLSGGSESSSDSSEESSSSGEVAQSEDAGEAETSIDDEVSSIVGDNEDDDESIDIEVDGEDGDSEQLDEDEDESEE